eukprot:2180956-Prymnesium_polylepis.1
MAALPSEPHESCRRPRGRIYHASEPILKRLSPAFNTALFAARANRFHVQPLRIGLAQTRKSWGAQQEQHPLRLELSSEQSGPWGVVEDEPVWDEYSGARKRVRRRFKLESSVWQPRKESGNSKDYYETSAAMRNTFKYDWDLAVMAHGLEQFIANSQLQAEKIGSKASVLTAMAEVKEAEEAVWRHQQIIYGAFDHYALKEWSNRVDRDGEANVWGLVFNAFLEFCRDMRWEHP